jgi:LysW-gamma-L-lysine carboxypeptidase
MSEGASSAPREPNDAQAIALIEALVRLYSPSGAEQAVAQCLVDAMAALGYAAQIDAAGNAVGVIGQGTRQIVLLGHMDTAPGIVPVRREGELLYGRGSVDAKGPLAAFVIAGARAARLGGLANLRVTVIGAVEEEAATSKGAYYVVEQYDRPDYTVIGEPSGWNRITLGYKGRLLIDYTLDRPMAHTAGQERGACEEALDFWLALREWAARYNQGKAARFETLDPSLRGICSDSDGLTESVHLHMGLRLPLELDVAELQQVLEVWRGAAQVRTYAYEQPFRADKSNPLTSAFLAAIRAEGGKAALVNKTGTSDMNVVGPRWGGPIVAYGPGDSALDHTPQEHLAFGEYLQAIAVLTRVLQRLGALS